MNKPKTDNTEEKCDHEGQWVGLGAIPLSGQKGVAIVHSLFCKRCGMSRTNVIPVAQISPIAVPSVGVKKGPVN